MALKRHSQFYASPSKSSPKSSPLRSGRQDYAQTYGYIGLRSSFSYLKAAGIIHENERKENPKKQKIKKQKGGTQAEFVFRIALIFYHAGVRITCRSHKQSLTCSPQWHRITEHGKQESCLQPKMLIPGSRCFRRGILCQECY